MGKVVKNASQTDREKVIGALDGKEVCREECSLAGRADASCRRRSVLSFRPKVILMLTTFTFSSFVLTGVDETQGNSQWKFRLAFEKGFLKGG